RHRGPSDGCRCKNLPGPALQATGRLETRTLSVRPALPNPNFDSANALRPRHWFSVILTGHSGSNRYASKTFHLPCEKVQVPNALRFPQESTLAKWLTD